MFELSKKQSTKYFIINFYLNNKLLKEWLKVVDKNSTFKNYNQAMTLSSLPCAILLH